MELLLVDLEFQLHDLNNKLSILYGLLALSIDGCPISEDRIDAVKSRINEIVKGLQRGFKFETSENLCLTELNQEDLCDFITSVMSKLGRIYSDVSFVFAPSPEKWNENYLIRVEKDLLYQAMENAVENSFKANALTIEFKLLEKQNQIILELCDNGKGLKDLEQVNNAKPATEACGLNIIKDNMKRMGAQTVYTQNSQNGVTLSFIFSPISISLTAL